MRVTVVITCHNYGDFVQDAIWSVIYQRPSDVVTKIVVVDDGSTDNSWEMIQKNREETTDIFRFDSPQGCSYVKNFVVDHMWDDTDAYAFLDADDMYCEQKVTKSLDLLSVPYGHPGIVYSDYELLDEVNGVRYVKYLPAYSGDPIDIGNFVVLKDVFKEVGGFNEELTVLENLDLFMRASKKFMVLHIPEPLVGVRLTARSMRLRVQPSEWARCNQILERGNAV